MSLWNSIKRNSPLLLSFTGVAGLVTTVIFTFKDAPKAVKALEEQREDSIYEPSIVEKASVIIPICWKEILAGSATAFCILFSNYISRKQQAALFGAAMLSSQMLEKLKKSLSPEQIEEAESKMANKDYKEQKIANVIHGDHDVLYYETYSDKWFYSNPADVLAAQYHFNRNFTIKQAINILEYLDFLGVELDEKERKYWSVYGYIADEFWDYGMMPWIDFEDHEKELEDGTKYHALSFTWEPRRDYENYGEK